MFHHERHLKRPSRTHQRRSLPFSNPIVQRSNHSNNSFLTAQNPLRPYFRAMKRTTNHQMKAKNDRKKNYHLFDHIPDHDKQSPSRGPGVRHDTHDRTADRFSRRLQLGQPISNRFSMGHCPTDPFSPRFI